MLIGLNEGILVTSSDTLHPSADIRCQRLSACRLAKAHRDHTKCGHLGSHQAVLFDKALTKRPAAACQDVRDQDQGADAVSMSSSSEQQPATHLLQRRMGAGQNRRGQLLKLLARHRAAEVDVVHEALHIQRRLGDGAQGLLQLQTPQGAWSAVGLMTLWRSCQPCRDKKVAGQRM